MTTSERPAKVRVAKESVAKKLTVKARTEKTLTDKARTVKEKKPAPPRNRETPDVRRKSLIQATIRSIAKHGYAGTTIETICTEAQVSRGLINHHFDTKEELIRQSYKEMCDEWTFQVSAAQLDSYREPEDKLRAIIRVNFGPTLFKQEYLAIWVGFWGAIGKSAALKKLNRELYNQDRQTYQEIFEAIAQKHSKVIDARRASIALTALMEGLWLQWCLDPKGFSAEDAEAVCLDYVARTFS